jgi:hypothetical protein
MRTYPLQRNTNATVMMIAMDQLADVMTVTHIVHGLQDNQTSTPFRVKSKE